MTAERDFADWIDCHSAEALARVFDAMAGRLLLLATQLAGAGATAEDLVQTTFLAAMAGASGWDRRRPLWPWLAGILHNEAKMHWRRVQRRREVELDAAAGAVGEAPDPARLAASDEAFAAVMAAIDALPLPYRQVLRLRLVHGLQPIEIARALEVPVGTVRAQLHRGLEQLRAALPAGVAVVAGAWLANDGALLAQVKAQVLAHAGAIAAAAAVATPASLLLQGGWWTMHGKAVGVAVAGVAMVLCLCYLFGVPSSFGAGASSPAVPSPVAADLGIRADEPHLGLQDGLQRTAAAVRPAPAWPLVVTVKARNGAPVAAASVRVWVAARTMKVHNQPPGEGQREEVASGETAADGTFHCQLDALRAHSSLYRAARWIWVSASGAGRTSDTRLTLPRSIEPHDFVAEIELPGGVGVVGRVVDARGQPVPRARLYFVKGTERLDLAYPSWAEDGTFWIRANDEWEQWPAGVIAVDAGRGGAFAAVPRPASMPAPGSTTDVGTLVLDERDAICGQVVLGDGSPLDDYPLYIAAIDPKLADDPAAIRRSFYARERGSPEVVLRQARVLQVVAAPNTRADGSFVCAGLDPEATYAVCVRDARLQYSVLVARPGDPPVRFEIEGQLLSLDVRSEQGEVLQGIDLLAEAYDPEVKRPSWKLRPGFPATGLVLSNITFAADAQGRLRLLSPFGWLWRIGISDESVQPDCLRHEAIAGVCRAERSFVLRPETRFGDLHLAVVDEQGEPYRDFGYQLQCIGRDLQRNGRLRPSADGMERELPAGRWLLTVYLGKVLRYGIWDACPRARGIDEQEIGIDDSRTTEVKIVAKALGRVGFRLQSDVPFGELKELHIRSEADGQEIAVEMLLCDGEKKPVLLARRAFAPGRHAFAITAKDHLPVRCEAEVVVDKATEIEVEMQRQQ